jgi:hypothetical protein
MNRTVLKIVGGFAAFGYLVAIGLYFVPPSSHLSLKVLYALWPAAFLITVSMTDPSFGAVALLLGQLNAVWYGFVGLVIFLRAQDFRRK